MKKVYVAYKPCDKPIPKFQHNGCEGGKDAKYMPASGVGYFEDDIGYYYKTGKLEVTNE